ncbi:hypothetical protein [Pedobacter punctiformis]|uniref:Secreted protein n=1 Tax=Pedobacter punctiformis TaxID=3004097 RepID=A0ABT4LC44_9SPHI|nr:hypothetical protein [Pedobacter sp. HCMS5-2]MCZ4245496.1 hypothetical protein [Pedobacter sp. HCMS5-2]
MKKHALYTILFLLGIAVTNTFAFVKEPQQVKIDTTQNTGYALFSKTGGIETVNIRKIKKGGNTVYVTLGIKKLEIINNNTTATGISGKSLSEQERNRVGPLFDKIDVLNGGYDDIKVDKLNADQNVYTIKNINYPLRLRMQSGKEIVEFELKEPGRWDVNINYKNN